MKKQLDAPEVASSRKIKFEEREESEENEGSGESSSEEEESEIGHELADVTFEDLQKARCDGTLAIHLKRDSNKSLKRANKNRPAEASSKKPVSKFREVVQAPKRVVRDPRFESLCGELDTERFKKKYNFIYEENLPSEKAELQKLLRTLNDPEAIEEMKSRISWIEKQLKSDSRKGREAQILAEHKKKEREAAKQGKKPYFLKKCFKVYYFRSLSIYDQGFEEYDQDGNLLMLWCRASTNRTIFLSVVDFVASCLKGASKGL